MSHFLFAVEIPPVPENSYGSSVAPEWSQFCNGTKSILATAKGSTEVASNVWLLPAENALPALLELSNLANHHKMAYSVLLIENFTDLSGKKSSGPRVRSI